MNENKKCHSKIKYPLAGCERVYQWSPAITIKNGACPAHDLEFGI